MRNLFLLFFIPLFTFAFDQNGLNELDSFTARGGTDPLALDSEKLIFAYKGSLGSYDRLSDESGPRYFMYQPAQRGNGPVISYRFLKGTTERDVKGKKSMPTRISFVQNLWGSLEFRTFEVGSDGKSLSSYQDCWQPDIKSSDVQCGVVNKDICDRINRGSYDWDKNYRKEAQAFREEMRTRLKEELLPESLNEQYSLSFKNYTLLDDYAPSKLLIDTFNSSVRIRLENVCKKFTWTNSSAVEKGFKH